MKRGGSPSVKRVVPVRKRFMNRHAFLPHPQNNLHYISDDDAVHDFWNTSLPTKITTGPQKKWEKEREKQRLEAASLSHYWSSDRVYGCSQQARPGQSLELVRTEKTLERHYYMRCQREGWRLLPIHTSTPTPTTNSKEKGDPEKEPNQVDFWWQRHRPFYKKHQRMQHLGRTSSPTSCPCK